MSQQPAQHPSNQHYPPGSGQAGPGQPGPPQYQTSYTPPQGAYQGPWPSQMPSGTFPGMPAVGLPRPLTLTLSIWLLVAGALLPLAVIPMMLDWMQAYVHEIFAETTARTGRTSGGTFVQQFSAIAAPVMWISAITTAAISVLMAFGVRAGMNWVRILLTVSTGLSVFGYLANVALRLVFALPMDVLYPLPVAVWVLTFTSGALYIAATVLSWLPPSSQFVAARRAAKLGGGYLG